MITAFWTAFVWVYGGTLGVIAALVTGTVLWKAGSALITWLDERY